MTVIAWDGTTLAADKRATCYGLARTVTKVFRLNDDEIAALAGTGAQALEILQWLRGTRDPQTFPKPSDPDTVNVLVVHRSGRIAAYEGHAFAVPYEDRFYAVGSGRDFALAAMHLGCDARKAVEVACAFDTNCGNGIDTLRFDP